MSNVSVAFVAPSGRIKGVSCLPEEMVEMNTPAGCSVIPIAAVFDPTGKWFDAGDFLDRPEMGLIINAEVIAIDADLIISGIPIGTRVSYPGGITVLDDTELAWSSAVPGNFVFHFEKWPFLDRVVYVKVA